MEIGGNGNVTRKNSENGNKCLTGVGMGLKLVGMERSGKAESYSRTALL